MKLEKKEGLSTIVRALNDRAALVRLAAVWGLYHLAGAECAPALTNMDRLRGEVDNLRRKLTGAENGMADLRIQLEEQEAANRELMETRIRLECEIKTAYANHEATKNELEMVKKALNDIRNEATLAGGRVRHRYFNPKNKK